VELRAVCQAADDTPCLNYAGFFLTKVDFAATLPPRAASLGFETVAEKEPGSQSGPLVHDARSLAMARRLWIFYGRDDPLANGRAVPADQETFSERYPYATAVIAIGIGAAVITGLKSAAGAGATH